MTTKMPFYIVFCLAVLVTDLQCYSQTDAQNFREYQFSSERVREAMNKYNDTLKKEFKAKNINWPPSDVYIRAFKSQNEMELWARNNAASEYKKIKTYNVCAISGSLGPKRQQGDKQVPEGYYFIDDFNPKSEYHLSMLLSYPNYSDESRGNGNPGGDIYIHGGCLTVGCLPMNNNGIKEIYTACLQARLNGQEYIPVHIFPTRMNKNGINYLIKEYDGNLSKQQFWANLKKGYEYFEQYHKLLPVMYAPDGSYVY
jgi:murein L,D-transpeptidase YafK